MSFQITNNGNAAANNILVYVLYADWYNISNCQSLIVPLVPAGSSVQQSIQASYPVYMINYYKIIVDPQNAILETNENNNVACEWDLDRCSAPPPTSCP